MAPLSMTPCLLASVLPPCSCHSGEGTWSFAYWFSSLPIFPQDIAFKNSYLLCYQQVFLSPISVPSVLWFQLCLPTCNFSSLCFKKTQNLTLFSHSSLKPFEQGSVPICFRSLLLPRPLSDSYVFSPVVRS